VDHNAQQLTTDYLAALKRHLMYMLQLQLGELQAKTIPLQFILTVPAVWSEIAKEKTLTAAEGAGLGDDAPILLVSEPVSWENQLGRWVVLTILRKLQQPMPCSARIYVILHPEIPLSYVMLEVEQLI
jgi:hypothetical protein